MGSKALEHAEGLYMEAIRDGNYEKALDKHVGSRYIQHSTGVPTGKEGFKQFFKSFLSRNPNRDMKVIRKLHDGRLAFVHVLQKLPDSGTEWVTMDMFDTDPDDDFRLLEHWDVIQMYVSPPDKHADLDMVQGPVDVVDEHKTEENKKVVRDFVKNVLTVGELSRMHHYVAENVVQHVHGLSQGRDAWRDALHNGTARVCEALFQIMGQGNFVVTLSKTRGGEQDQQQQQQEGASFDLYRVADGLIAECWAVFEPILPRDQWGNAGKF